MSAIEESLRRALDNGDAADPAFRRTIYAASERALERMLAARELDEQSAAEQRQRLGDTIDRVEHEYAAQYGAAQPHENEEYAQGVAQAGLRPDPDDDGGGAAPDEYEAPLRRSPGSFTPPAQSADGTEAGATWQPGSDRASARPARRRRGRLLLVVLATLIFLAIMAYVASVVFAPSDAATAGPDEAGGQPEQAANAPPPPDLNWIEVFSGGDLQSLSAPSGGRIEAIEAQGSQAVRVAGAEGVPSEILLAVGPGLVGEIAGSSVRIEIRAGSPDGKMREFAVSCVFGEASICDRQRFATSMSEEAFVFDVEIPEDVETPAILAIDPGLGEGGPDLDLYAVRVRTL